MKYNVWNEKCIISPSLICLDMCRLSEQVAQLEAIGINMLHIDILDGHFSPSMPLGFETVRQLRDITALAFDCHVMADPPDYFIDELLDIGVQQVTFHVETARHVDGMLNKIHSKGVRAGVALKPSTPLCELDYILDKCDAVLLMLINPGYASSGQESQVPYADKKIRELRSMIAEKELETKIEIDGRISKENIRQYGFGTVDLFVGGTTCISRADIPGTMGELMKIRQQLIGYTE